MEFDRIKNLKENSEIDLEESFKYFLKSFAYSFLLGAAVIAVAKNYKKAMLNEESYTAYKFFRKMQERDDIS
jgi:hypothetical protein